jgi:hypothetical protein
MLHSHRNETARERRVLCCAALVCYSVSLASLTVMAYSLTTLALGAVGQQVAAAYHALGVVAY